VANVATVRKLHANAGVSEKVSRLSDFEYRVWTQYLLSADDFGVMPATAFVLQADSVALSKKTTKAVQKALDEVIASGLIAVFTHQGQRYVYQGDWQDWQDIRWPRRTKHPIPTDLTNVSELTRELFRDHPRKLTQHFGSTSEKVPKNSGSTSEVLTSRARARNRTPNSDLDLKTEESKISTASEPASHPPEPDRRHGVHAWCSDRGLCIPWGLHSNFVARLNVPDADARLRAWYPTVVAQYEGQPIGDDLFAFWRHAFQAWIGTVTSTRSRRQLDERRTWLDECREIHGGTCENSNAHWWKKEHEQQTHGDTE
jgi:hypothetical protein